MGRRQYLVRLALGRSAFDGNVEPADTDSTLPLDEQGGDVLSGNPQQYDESGRPVNPGSKALSESQVRAKNEVLEAVGVTERKSKQSARPSSPGDALVLSSEEWTTLKEAEDEVGDDIFLISDLGHLLSTWWLDTLRKRILAGLVDCTIPMASILTREWSSLLDCSITEVCYRLTAGLGVELVGNLTFEVVIDSLDNGITKARRKLDRRGSESHFKNTANTALRCLRMCGHLGLQLLLCPLSIASVTQQLHLQPSSSTFPILVSLLPWHPTSPLQWGWSPDPPHAPFHTRLLNVLLSPVSLCIISHGVSDWVSHAGNFIQDYDSQPAILAPSKAIRGRQEKLGLPRATVRLMQPFVSMRDVLLQAAGWSHEASELVISMSPAPLRRARSLAAVDTTDLLVSLGASEAEAASHHLQSTREGGNLRGSYTRLVTKTAAFRSTHLSLLPAEMLGHRLNALVWKVLKGPLSMVFYRSVVRAWLASPLGSEDALVMKHAGADMDLCLSISDVSQPLFNKFLFCVALEAASDACIWGWICAVVGRIGRERFHWGRT